MMNTRSALSYFAIGAVLIFGVFHAIAQPAGQWMSAEEMRRELFGVRLTGTAMHNNQHIAKWQECIQPDGHTLYTYQSTPPRAGYLAISEDARACFRYGGRESCFRVARVEDDYAFYAGSSAESGTGLVYRTELVERGVRQCGDQLVG